MNFWLYRKKKYLVDIKKIIKNNDFFFFWNYRESGSSLKSFLLDLEKLNINTLWLKRSVFSSVYINDSNIKLKYLLKSQSYFSYSQLSIVNFNDLINFIEKNKKKLIFLGFLFNKNVFIDSFRFNYIKKDLKNFQSNMSSLYRILLQKIFVFFVLNRLLLFKFFYISIHKKNLTLID